VVPAEVYRRAAKGDTAAVQEVFEANKGLVHFAVKPLCLHMSHEEQDDVYQEGKLGLCKAASYYDVDSGHAFATYAVTTIRREVIRAINTRSIRLPEYLAETLRKYCEIWRNYIMQNQQQPSEDYMMAAVGRVVGSNKPITRKKVRELHDLMQKQEDGIVSLQWLEEANGEVAVEENSYSSVDFHSFFEEVNNKMKREITGGCDRDCSGCNKVMSCDYVVCLLFYSSDIEPAASIARGCSNWRGTKEDVAAVLSMPVEEVASIIVRCRKAFGKIRRMYGENII
jgi:RNA polymerase sigma factor (sigma-70 family)